MAVFEGCCSSIGRDSSSVSELLLVRFCSQKCSESRTKSDIGNKIIRILSLNNSVIRSIEYHRKHSILVFQRVNKHEKKQLKLIIISFLRCVSKNSNTARLITKNGVNSQIYFSLILL